MFQTATPMITAIMPTTASRLKYLPGALQVFFSQTYPNKELVVVSEDDLSAHIPDHPFIRFIKTENRLTVGAKRNLACDSAKGECIVHWDDDDWSSPTRMAEQLAVLKRHEIAVTGYNSAIFYRESTGEAHAYTNDDLRFACGTSLMYLRGYQRSHPFLDLNVGEDVNFVYRVPNGSLLAVPAGRACVARDHDDNTSPREAKPIGEFWKQVDAGGIAELIAPKRRHVVLSLLTWNTKDVSLEGLEALKKEAHRFRCLGYEASIVVVDNGSTDGLQAELKKHKDVKVILNKTNRGSSVARNQIIDHAKKLKADYLFFNDGDITCVPWSVVSIVDCMEERQEIPCLGAYWENWSADPAKCSPYLVHRIEPIRCDVIAPTQYGVWRKSLFDAVRFDEKLGAGWAFDDDDYFMQMKVLGFTPYIFRSMVYQHRHIHHGLHNHPNGNELYEERRQYMISKWKDEPLAQDFMDYYKTCQPPPKVA